MLYLDLLIGFPLHVAAWRSRERKRIHENFPWFPAEIAHHSNGYLAFYHVSSVKESSSISTLFPAFSTRNLEPVLYPLDGRPKINVRPFISGAYIIRFFTRPASTRMTNWNNNNGYILQRKQRRWPRLERFEIHLLPQPETQSNPVGQEEDPTALPYLSS